MSPEQELDRIERIISARMAFTEAKALPEFVDYLAEIAERGLKAGYDLKTIVNEQRGRLPQLFGASEPKPAAPNPAMGETMTERMVRLNGERRAASKAPRIEPGRNPWLKNKHNLTEQMTISKFNPELAAKLRAEAGR